jgi:5-methylcytosine-specific restriction endonuclease McrA
VVQFLGFIIEFNRLFNACFLPFTKGQICKLSTPHRWTLLHDFIHCFFWDSYEDFENHFNDSPDTIIREYATVLSFYGKPYPDFEVDNLSDAYEHHTRKYISLLRELLPSVHITQDTFHLLFGNRLLLLRFNEEIARLIREQVKGDVHIDVAERDGVLRRVYLPQWVKRAVFYRDHGRCVTCGKDLTGTVFISEDVHYDHVVPLVEGGSNDPTNFQLMCADCNLSKSQQARTSEVYHAFWNLDETAELEARRYAKSRARSLSLRGIEKEAT